jgi:hypothetical protein
MRKEKGARTSHPWRGCYADIGIIFIMPQSGLCRTGDLAHFENAVSPARLWDIPGFSWLTKRKSSQGFNLDSPAPHQI